MNTFQKLSFSHNLVNVHKKSVSKMYRCSDLHTTKTGSSLKSGWNFCLWRWSNCFCSLRRRYRSAQQYSASDWLGQWKGKCSATSSCLVFWIHYLASLLVDCFWNIDSNSNEWHQFYEACFYRCFRLNSDEKNPSWLTEMRLLQCFQEGFRLIWNLGHNPSGLFDDHRLQISFPLATTSVSKENWN